MPVSPVIPLATGISLVLPVSRLLDSRFSGNDKIKPFLVKLVLDY